MGFALFGTVLCAQIIMQKNAPALLQICVRDSIHVDPISCTNREMMRVIINEVMQFKKWNSMNATVNLDIHIAVNDPGTIAAVQVNKNSKTLENTVAIKLKTMDSFFPARENGVFIKFILTYHVDDMTLLDYRTQEEMGGNYTRATGGRKHEF